MTRWGANGPAERRKNEKMINKKCILSSKKMAAFSGAFRVLMTDQLCPYLKPYISIGPLRPPISPADAASKQYVDNAVGVSLHYTPPLLFDVMTSTVSISDAGVLSSGVVTTGPQTLGGNKTFTGTVRVPVPPISDSSSMVATTSWVRNLTNNAPYEASNGWIGGGIITFAPSSAVFSVSAMTCRFTDYTDESNPVAGPVVTLPAQINVLSSNLSENVVGIYMDTTGTIIQDPGTAWNTTLLYGDRIRLGMLVQRGGVIEKVSNSKYPVADRNNLETADFINQISPLLISGSSVTASITLPADLSIWVNQAYIWEQMANITVSRTNPSTIFVLDKDRPTMHGVWRNTAGDLIITAGSTQLDVHNCNIGGTGGALTEITAGYWVNIPILYNASADTYLFQYPTAQYPSSDTALSMVGRFTRLGITLQHYVVRGFVTVQKDSANLSAAFFSDGEYFNYTVGSGNIGGSSAPVRNSNTAWVDEMLGDDATGTVTYMNKPYQEHDTAAAGITTATANSPFLLSINAGHHVETTMLLKPFVVTSSSTPRATYIEVVSGYVGLDPSFATAANALSGLSSVTLMNGTGMMLNLASIGGVTTAQLEFSSMLSEGAVVFSARTISDVIKFDSLDCEAGATFNGGEVIIIGSEFDAATTLKFDSTLVPCVGTVGGSVGYNLALTNNNSGVPCTVTVTGTSFSGALTLNGLGVVLNIDRGSLPPTINPILNGAVLNVINDLLTQDVVASLNNAATPLTSTNVVIDKFTYTAAMSGKVATSTTVNGHPLSANVTVGASELGAGTIPRAQLPLPWLSADIPNNTANTSGSAASLSAVSALPNGTTATTQGSVAVPDNSTKVATTAYVDRLRGAVSGVATLDGTGKIPIEQIDLGALGSLTYRGTWDASLGVYPSPVGLVSGWFYITSVAGTISGTHYNVGDWMVYNGVSWDKVTAVDIGAYLSTWTGSTSVITVGTITTGTWHADAIGSAYGGAGGIAGPALLKGTAGVVSAATVDTDYVSPSTASTITGDKYFSGNTTAVTQLSTDSSTKLATTAYVQSAANVPQANVIYLSHSGNDVLDGSTGNNAVLTFSRAVAIAVAGVPSLSNKFAIRSPDTSFYDVTNLPANGYIDFDGSSNELRGKLTLADFNVINCRRFTTPAVAKGILIHFSGGTNTVSSFVTAKRLSAGQIYVDSTQGTRSIDIAYIDGLPLTTDPVITCNANSTLYVKSNKIRGLITATGTNAVIDLTQVGDLTEATFSVGVDPGCIIKFPASGAGNAAGILKGNGSGGITTATPGTGNDYLKVNDTITLSSDVTGSGSTAITTTIAAGAVTLAKMANLSANSLVGNPTGSPATPSAVQMSSASNPSQIAVRDVNANLCANHMTEGILSIPTAGGVTSFSSSTPAYVQFTGVLAQTAVLPDATTLTVGYRFNIHNAGTLPIVVEDHGATLLFTQNSTVTAVYVCASILTSAGIWVVTPVYRTRFLTGDVTGSGAETTSTTISAGAIDLSKMGPLAANSVIGNITGAPATPSAVSVLSTASANAVILRDANASSQGNHFTENFETHGAGVTLTATSAPIQNFTGAGGYTVALPAANTLPLYFKFIISNSTSGVITVNDGSGGLVLSMATSTQTRFTCTNIGSIAGSWAFTQVVQNTTLTGDVTGSGTSSVATTISAGAVTLAKMAALTANSLLGNPTGSPAAPSAVSMTSAVSASAVSLRDANASTQANHFTENFESHGAGVTLTVASAPIQTFTGAGGYVVALPAANTLALYFKFIMSNNTSGTLTVNDGSGSLVLSMATSTQARFTCTDVSSVAGSWSFTRVVQSTALTGDVTGSGTSSVATTIASGAVTLSKMANLSANSLIGNPTGSSATPSAVSMSSAASANVVALRDVSANVQANHFTENFETHGAGATLSVTSAPIQTFTGAGGYIVALPAANTLSLYFKFIISNSTSGTLTVNDGSGGLVLSMAASTQARFTCTNVGSVAGSWSFTQMIQNTTLTGDVTGSGTSSVATTIASGAITTAKMANFAANSIIANLTGAPAAPSALTITSTGSTASSAVLRDASANVSGNAVIQRYRTQATASGTTTLLISDPPIEEFTGTLTQTVLLPDATLGMTTGYTVTVIDSSSGSLTVQTSTANLVKTVIAGERCNFICNTLSNAASSWTTNSGLQSSTVTLTGGAVGSGSVGSSISTTIGAGTVSWGVGGSLASTLANGNVLGNLSGVAAAPAAVQAVSTNTASTVVTRDASSNTYLNNVIKAAALPTGNIVLTAASNPIQYFAESVTGDFSVQLPNATTLTLGFRFTIINDDTGVISVNNATPTLLLCLPKYSRGTLVCSNIGSSAGSWEITIGSMMPPTRLFTTSAHLTTSQTLTCAQLYGGPILSNTSNVTLTLPTAANFFSQMTAILGYSPPTGFNFTTVFMCLSNTMTIAFGGAHQFPSASKNVANGRCATMTIWVEDGGVNQYYDATLVVSGS